MPRAVFLDRDGVLNEARVDGGRTYAPTRIEDFRILAGVPAAVRRLRDAGYLIVVVTNQPDVATGAQSLETVEAMHRQLRAEVAVDAIKACFHTDADGCHCRKPRPGMIFEAAREYGIDLAASYMIGDRWRDIEAGHAAGCATIFIDVGLSEKRPVADHTATDLGRAADIILFRPSVHSEAS